MNKPPLRIRLRKPNGVPIAREALSINFYMRHPRREIAPALLRSIDRYRRVLGNDVLSESTVGVSEIS